MKKYLVIFLFLILFAGLNGLSLAQDGKNQQRGRESIEVDTLIDAFFTKRTGDLQEMLKRHQIRVLVVPGRSTYFLDKAGQPRGMDYELLKGYEKILNRKRNKGDAPVSVIFIPVTLEELGDALLDGRGDIAGITLITPGRAEEFAYTIPVIGDIREVIVTRKGGPAISKLEDLSGQEVYVVSGSAQMESMARLNDRLKKEGLAPIKVIQTEPYVDDENLLEMIHAGMIPAGVVPDAFAHLWKKVFKNLVIHEKTPVSRGMKAAWAVRKENPELLASMNAAISSVLKKNKRAFERDFNQYFKRTHWITNPFTKGSKFQLSSHFERESAAFGMDWLQLMAQGFQESALNHKAKSPYGAVGIMQVLPSTAEWLGVSNYMEIEGNVHAGAKYMNMLMNRYAKDPDISKEDRFFFALASYNAGPGRVGKYRKRAVKLGYDPNKWFGNVERVALRSGNLETVMYVRNILNYTMAYKTAYERSLLRGNLKEK
ncbi:MAG: transporter substrate-binding domain-containing protein [Deltaproteobacteria bacterium]|nr:transporter substrate-binding domain-containing protein [Deltaproteobacteria bacterium]